MSTIKAIVRGGQLELEQPIDLPDGTELLIPVPDVPHDHAPMSPEEMTRVLAAMDRMIPFDLTAEDEVRLESDRRNLKAWELDRSDLRDETLRSIWP